jgi:hypothetical protein
MKLSILIKKVLIKKVIGVAASGLIPALAVAELSLKPLPDLLADELSYEASGAGDFASFGGSNGKSGERYIIVKGEPKSLKSVFSLDVSGIDTLQGLSLGRIAYSAPSTLNLKSGSNACTFEPETVNLATGKKSKWQAEYPKEFCEKDTSIKLERVTVNDNGVIAHLGSVSKVGNTEGATFVYVAKPNGDERLVQIPSGGAASGVTINSKDEVIFFVRKKDEKGSIVSQIGSLSFSSPASIVNAPTLIQNEGGDGSDIRFINDDEVSLRADARGDVRANAFYLNTKTLAVRNLTLPINFSLAQNFTGSIIGGKTTDYLNQRAVAINSKGEVVDLNCAMDPTSDKILSEVLAVSKDGTAIVVVTSKESFYPLGEVVLVDLKNLDSLPNNCGSIEITPISACKPYFREVREYDLLEQFKEIPAKLANKCQFEVTVRDQKNKPVRKANVKVFKNLVTQESIASAKTDRRGKARLKIAQKNPYPTFIPVRVIGDKKTIYKQTSVDLFIPTK